MTYRDLVQRIGQTLGISVLGQTLPAHHANTILPIVEETLNRLGKIHTLDFMREVREISGASGYDFVVEGKPISIQSLIVDGYQYQPASIETVLKLKKSSSKGLRDYGQTEVTRKEWDVYCYDRGKIKTAIDHNNAHLDFIAVNPLQSISLADESIVPVELVESFRYIIAANCVDVFSMPAMRRQSIQSRALEAEHNLSMASEQEENVTAVEVEFY